MQGWGTFILKEKLKGLKKWNKEHFDHLGKRLEVIQHEMNETEVKGESVLLNEEEVRITRGVLKSS